MEKTTMRFLFGDRELLLTVADLLSAPVEVIVNPAEPRLQHQQGLARTIRQRAGDQLQQDSEQLIREYGVIDTGMAVYTSAGELPFKAIIHAVGPAAGEGDEQRKLEQAVSRSLQLCEMNEWCSIGFPVLGTVEPALCAQAFFRAITRFWDARHDCPLEKVVVYLQQDQFEAFFAAFREQGFTEEAGNAQNAMSQSKVAVGEIELSEADIANQDNSDIDSWFK
jgi:O-acetyl-ADP-ribose deacetylase (regulator of RNase III)